MLLVEWRCWFDDFYLSLHHIFYFWYHFIRVESANKLMYVNLARYILLMGGVEGEFFYFAFLLESF
jgi:hypothetical protein